MRKQTGRRTDLMDTSEWAHRLLVERLRAMTPEERLSRMFDSIQTSEDLNRQRKSLLTGHE